MKRFLVIILPLLSCLWANAQSGYLPNRRKAFSQVVVANCVWNQNITNNGGYISINFSASTRYLATSFSPANTINVCGIEWLLGKQGSPTFNVGCAIWSDSGGYPSSLLETSSFTTNAATLTTGATAVKFAFSGSTVLSSGTRYYVTVFGDANGNGSDFIRTRRSTSIAGEALYYSTNTSVWVTTITNAQANLTLFAQ